MTPKQIAGLVLVVAGLIMLVMPLTYKSQEDVINVGGLKASVETKKEVPMQPLIGGVMLAGGVALVLLGKKKK